MHRVHGAPIRPQTDTPVSETEFPDTCNLGTALLFLCMLYGTWAMKETSPATRVEGYKGSRPQAQTLPPSSQTTSSIFSLSHTHFSYYPTTITSRFLDSPQILYPTNANSKLLVTSPHTSLNLASQAQPRPPQGASLLCTSLGRKFQAPASSRARSSARAHTNYIIILARTACADPRRSNPENKQECQLTDSAPESIHESPVLARGIPPARPRDHLDSSPSAGPMSLRSSDLS